MAIFPQYTLYISVGHAALKFQGVTSISSQAGYGMVIMVVKEYLHSPECWFIPQRKICPTIRTNAISFTVSAGRRAGAGVDTVTEYEVRPANSDENLFRENESQLAELYAALRQRMRTTWSVHNLNHL